MVTEYRVYFKTVGGFFSIFIAIYFGETIVDEDIVIPSPFVFFVVESIANSEVSSNVVRTTTSPIVVESSL